MGKQSQEEKERLEKLNDTFLYNIGYEHVKNVYDIIDTLINEYNDIHVPDSLNKWFFDYQKAITRKEMRVRIKRKVAQISKKVAEIFIAISIIGSFITISVEAFRVRFFNMIIETTQRFSSISHKENVQVDYLKKLPLEWNDYYYPTLLPQEYNLVIAKEFNNTKYMTFTDNQNNEIKFIQGSLTSEAQLDSEQGKVIEVEINGNRGILIEKENLCIISWNDNYKSFYIQGNVEKSILLEIASSLEKINKKF